MVGPCYAEVSIEPSRVHLALAGGAQRVLDNDEVFVMIGGAPPFPLLQSAGVSFDPAERKRAAPVVEQGTGFLKALVVAFALALVALGWSAAFSRYYALEAHERPWAQEHALLKPTGLIGLACGIGAVLLILANLAYLLRRSQRVSWIRGSLQGWMTSHVVTGISAFLLVVIHSGLAPEHTVGGHAFIALAILIMTGAIGRYFYSFVPRAANGRELLLEEVQARLATLSGEWDRHNRGFGDKVRAEVQRLQAESHWHASFPRRVWSLVTSHRALRSAVAKLRAQALREGIAGDQIDALVTLARSAQRTALVASHYEDVRALLSSWRYFHRWVALAMVLLTVMHVVTALRYGRFGG